MNHTAPKTLKIAALVTLAIATLIGCDDRATRIAEEAADRQADQNRELVRLNREVAAGTSRLVTEDAKARRHALRVHQDLQHERAGLSAGWGALETERKQIAQSRRTDSALAALVSGGAATMAALVALALAWLAFYRRGPSDESADAVYDLMIASIIDVPPEFAHVAPPSLAKPAGSLPAPSDADARSRPSPHQ